jgi:type II secretory pathway component PulK
LAVLVVIVVLTLAAYQFSELMMAEFRAADSYTRSAQARALAESGIHYAAAALSNPDTVAGTLNGNPFDNANSFKGVIVQPNDKPRFQGRFSLVAPLDPDAPTSGTLPYRFGVTDECGKINLNALMKRDSGGTIAHDMLMALPNMTEDIANSIVDWLDSDSDARPNGAEDDYYSGLTPPYHCKNAPLDSIEELLLVKGVTPQLLFGNDRNRNGILDPEEDDGTGVLDRGWSAFLTIYSRESNIDADGNSRIYVNDKDLQGLYDKLNAALGEDLANYIIAYRLYGPAATPAPASSGGAGSGGGGSSGGGASGSGSAAGGGSSAGSGSSAAGGGAASGKSSGLTRSALGNLQQSRPRSIGTLYELVDSSVAIPTGGTATTTLTTFSPDGKQITMATTSPASLRYPSPLNDAATLKQLLPLLLDKVTTVRDADIPARININTAPREVLAALPGLSDTDVQNILDQRPNPSGNEAPDPIFQTPAWLITEAGFSSQTLRTLEKYITARSQVYRLQSLGYFDGGGPTARIEAVVDTNGGRPRIVYWRDLTELGKGFNLQSGQ